jgi:hypothetical protein
MFDGGRIRYRSDLEQLSAAKGLIRPSRALHLRPGHDPEKCEAVFGKDHAPTKRSEGLICQRHAESGDLHGTRTRLTAWTVRQPHPMLRRSGLVLPVGFEPTRSPAPQAGDFAYLSTRANWHTAWGSNPPEDGLRVRCLTSQPAVYGGPRWFRSTWRRVKRPLPLHAGLSLGVRGPSAR